MLPKHTPAANTTWSYSPLCTYHCFVASPCSPTTQLEGFSHLQTLSLASLWLLQRTCSMWARAWCRTAAGPACAKVGWVRVGVELQAPLPPTLDPQHPPLHIFQIQASSSSLEEVSPTAILFPGSTPQPGHLQCCGNATALQHTHGNTSPE